jgi:uncharacterized membrane protein YhiD involved in acid resistance
MLLALGSALFGTLSVGAFGSFIDGSNAHVSFDPSRIASYVVAGIGFLGAGSILKRDDRVHTPVASPDEHVERTSASDGAQSRTSA